MQYSTYMQTRWLLNLNTPQNWVKRAKNKLKGQILIYVCQPSTSHILFSLTASVLTNKHCKCNEACRTIIQQCHEEANLKLPNDEQRNSWFYNNQQTMQYKTKDLERISWFHSSGEVGPHHDQAQKYQLHGLYPSLYQTRQWKGLPAMPAIHDEPMSTGKADNKQHRNTAHIKGVKVPV